MKIRIKKGDTVIVLSGDDKGKVGKVKEVLRAKGKVIVEGVNIVKKAMRPSKVGGQSGLVEKENPIHVSKVALYDGKSGKPTRIRMGVSKDGRKVRVGVKTQTVFD
jgi:large subunit ribosomal protein L24